MMEPTLDELRAREGTVVCQSDLYRQAVEEAHKAGKASISMLQRRLRIGYGLAKQLIDQLEVYGIIEPEQVGGTRSRRILPQSNWREHPEDHQSTPETTKPKYYPRPSTKQKEDASLQAKLDAALTENEQLKKELWAALRWIALVRDTWAAIHS